MSTLELTDTQWSAMAAEFCKGFTKEQEAVCRTFCEIRGLLPGRHIVFMRRNSKEWDETINAKVSTTKIIFITTIDAARLIAQRTGQYNGQAPEEYIYLDEHGAPSIVSQIPLPRLPIVQGQAAVPREPWAVRTTVYRKDFDHPISSVARFDAYAATYTNNGEVRLNEMWSRRPAEQLAKCSEMLSLRKAFAEELGGVFLDSEIKPDQEEVLKQPISPAVAVSLPPPVPAVNQTPAQPTEAPRPNEEKRLGPNPTQDPDLEKDREKLVEEIKKTVPGIKPASELPEPKKRGRKPKEKPETESPVNGRPTDNGITDDDFAQIGTPGPETNTEENKKEAQEFVEAVTSFTPTEAAAQGLPDPGDQAIPEGKVKDGFVTRMRALVCPGVDIHSLGEYTLGVGQKTSSKFLTVGDWNKALATLEAAKKTSAEALKEVLKTAPKPPF